MKPIAIPRPDDPEGQELWDEAKLAVEEREAERVRKVMLDAIQHVKDCRAAGVEPVYPVQAAVDAALACLCGKRTTCACQMRLPVVDEASETGSVDE